MKFSKTFLRVATAAAALTAAVQADAATFVLTSTGPGTAPGTQARQGFEIAAAYWASVLTNNVTINLNIGFSALGTGILGSTSSRTSVNFNSQVYSALAGNITSTVDAQAVATLRPLTPTASFGNNGLTMTTNALNAAGNGYVDTATRVDNDGSINNVAISVNTSVDKALGITTDANGNAVPTAGADGSITFSNLFAFDFDPTNGIDADKFDFIGVAIHEIGHALGFRSGVDTYDAFTAPGAANTNPGALEGFVVGTSLDLFRYSSAGNLDWSTQNTPYFSINGGVSQLYGDSRFSQGVSNGDGRQASHWKDSAAMNPQLGIMDPTSGFGQMQEVTALDIAAFDAIGWKTSFDANLNQGYRFTTADAYRSFVGQATPVVPEPATWLMMILGFGMVGYSMRRRSAKVAFA